MNWIICRGTRAILIACLPLASYSNAQPDNSMWVTASPMPPLTAQDWERAPWPGDRPIDLDRLSDEQLLDVYVAAYQRSLRAQVADDSALVEPGRFLLQLGYTYSSNTQHGLQTTTHTVPELMVRYRLFPRWEVRVAWAGVTRDGLTDEVTGISDWETRLSDPSVGARVALSPQRAWLPRSSLTISSPLNVDSNAALVNRLDPFVGLGYSWLLGEKCLLSGTSAMVWTREEDDRYLDFQQSVSVDRLAGDRWGLSFEWSSLFPEGARADGMSHTLGPGVSYSLTRDLQLDVIVMFGLDEASPDVLTQTFVSWRF